MKKSDFYFDLPERLIAQHPMEQRDASRMLVMDRKTGELSHRHFHDLIEYLKPGDCLVMNNSRVIPARLMGQAEGRTTPIEVVLLTDHGDGVGMPDSTGQETREGVKLSFGDGLLTGVVESVSPRMATV
ncbi:MAG: S-adenosylmethionine:tRNA ribosyltransferase-isomerase [Butyricicoccus pullicaecorum]